jgi:hypothetical protein
LFATGESRWLGVQVQVPGEIEQPRVLLVSVPYALKAADAETLLVANGGTGVTAAQGNGTKVQLSTGTTTANDCVKFDGFGNTIDAGAPCGSGSGFATLTAANTFTAGPQTVQTGADANKGVVVKGNSATQSANLLYNRK